VTSLVDIAQQLADAVDDLSFSPPVTHVYNPLAYAWEPHRRYLERWGGGRKEVVLLGMNPGPWGMAQTGVPFGEVALVRDWVGVEAPVGKPAREHPKRPVEGFGCARSEVSGRRLWGWARERFGTPEAFFARFLVLNYCPLVFLEESGRNRTPDKLPAAERGPLEAACDRALRSSVAALSPTWVIGVGGFAERSARRALAGLDVRVGRVLHPSPASPAANLGWAHRAEAELIALGISLPG
jgi:single-strand selective monofunctional uracil DNA glycosylase